MASHLYLPRFQLFQNRRALGLVGIHSGYSSWTVSDGSILRRRILALFIHIQKRIHFMKTGQLFSQLCLLGEGAQQLGFGGFYLFL